MSEKCYVCPKCSGEGKTHDSSGRLTCICDMCHGYGCICENQSPEKEK